ncbi:MAG: hypothetical protein U1E27_12635, partial [Kiritimatiellia bacterium]|nr:hypothetical protein [Kiritimatiellia bacterium]
MRTILSGSFVMTYAVHGSAGLLLAGFLVACGPTPDPIPAPPPDEQPATPPQRPAERTATGNPGAVSVDRRFADDVSLHFPDRAGTASVRPIPYHPPGVDEIAMTVESSAPVVIGIRSGIFPVIPDAEYAVNFSDRPAIWLRADEKGTLAIPINP